MEIPSGRFLMGSAKGEAGSYDDERPWYLAWEIAWPTAPPAPPPPS